MAKAKCVAIIDDDIIYRITTQKILEHSNLTDKILFFSDGEEAIEYLSIRQNRPEELPDVILLDLNMPVMDGWDFLEEYIIVKPKIGKQITIYVVSSSVRKSDIEKAKKISEVTDYIVKPVTGDALTTILRGL